MKILVLYATTEGQTRKIAEFVATQLKGDEVVLIDAADTRAKPGPEGFDAVFLAASLHAGQYQHSIKIYARDHHAKLNQMPSLFISVSLAAAGDDPEDLKGIADCAERFKADTGWSGAQVRHVAGAFRFTKYDFFKGWVMRMIAKSKGVKVAPHEDLELTNWKSLEADVAAFRAQLSS